MEWIFNIEQIREVAADFWKKNDGKKLFAFHGEMGAGKTTFIHALCDEKKVQGRVSSPTFSIINEYVYSGGPVYHIDLYRVKDEEEAVRAGVEDCLYSGEICLVEWPGKAAAIFPEEKVDVFIEALADGNRRVKVE